MFLCNGKLLVLRVSRDLDQFHPVEQRGRDRCKGVGSCDEQHIGEVIGDLEVVVREGVVLLRVEDLEERTCRVARIGHRQLVDLVEDEDRVLRAGFLDALDDPPGQGADIGPPVPPDLGLVPDAAKADPDIFPAQCLRDALPEARLPGAGRAGKEEDRTLLLCFEFHDRKVLDDPFLDFLKAVVVALEHTAGLGDIDALLLFGHPREVEQEVKVVPDHGTFMVLAAAGLEFFCLDERLFAHVIRHLRVLDPFAVPAVPGSTIALAQFFLDYLQSAPAASLPGSICSPGR